MESVQFFFKKKSGLIFIDTSHKNPPQYVFKEYEKLLLQNCLLAHIKGEVFKSLQAADIELQDSYIIDIADLPIGLYLLDCDEN